MPAIKLSWSLIQELSLPEVSNYVPNNEGVYLLLVKSSSGGWRCFYTSASQNMKESLLKVVKGDVSDFKMKELVKNYFCAFIYANCSPLINEQVAGYITSNLKPEFNSDQLSLKECIEVNLPFISNRFISELQLQAT